MCHKFVPDEEYETVSGFYAYTEGMEINMPNIRIWIHEKDLGCLERVLWEGQGHLLLGQTAGQSKIRKFLEAVPKIMNEIKDVHEAAVLGDVGKLVSREFRQPVYTSKDVNGLSAFHKAVANSHKEVAEHLMEKTDRAVLRLTDRQGRTALHYAAGMAQDDALHGQADEDEDESTDMYKWLLRFGPDEKQADALMNLPAFYLNHGHQIRYSLCSHIPEAPRIVARVPYKRDRSMSPTKSPSKSPVRGDSSDEDDGGSKEGRTSPNRKANKQEGESGEEKKPTPLPPWHKITKEHVSKWIKTANLPQLEHAAYMGKSRFMLGRTAWNDDVRAFLQTVPKVAAAIEHFHSAAAAGDHQALQKALASDRRLIASRDQHGRTALHKAAQEGSLSAVEALLSGDLTSSESLARAEDRDGRSALHFAARCPDERAREEIVRTIVQAGADGHADDHFGHPPSFYEDNPFSAAADAESDAAIAGGSSPAQMGGGKEREDGQSSSQENGAQQYDKEKQEDDAERDPAEVSARDRSAVSEAVRTKDFARLVEMVLAGRGDAIRQWADADKSLEEEAVDEEVQEFVDNVPAFQEKILSLARAVESGSLRQLQSLLDRKKFALSRDADTGVNLLQKAVALGHMDIARYLATNFPKVLSLRDRRGRTCLHYSALAKDPGQCFRMLANAGADRNIKDRFGNVGETYARSLGGRQAVAEGLQEMRQDVRKATFDSAKFTLRAASLDGAEGGGRAGAAGAAGGKGVRDFRAQDSVAQNTFDEAYETSDFEEEGDDDQGESQLDEEAKLAIESSFRRLTWARQSPSLLKRFLTKPVLERVKGRVTSDGATLADVVKAGVENLDCEVGVLLPDAESYRVFWPLLRPLVAAYHGAYGRKLEQPRTDWPQPKKVDDADGGGGARVQAVLLEARRNLLGFPMLTRMETVDFTAVERVARAAFGRMEGDFSGNFYAVPTGLSAKIKAQLEEHDALFADDDDELRAGGAYEHWPHGRGVFASHDRRVHIWLNNSDHFRFRCRLAAGAGANGGNGKFRSAYEHFRRALDHWQGKLTEVVREEGDGGGGGDDDAVFSWDDKLGFVTLSPAHLGTALQVTLRVKLEYLSESEVRRICGDYGLRVERDRDADEETDDNDEGEGMEGGGSNAVFTLRNRRTFGLSEKDVVLDAHGCLGELLQRDRESERRGRRATAADSSRRRRGRRTDASQE